MTAPAEWLPDWVEHPDLDEESGALDTARLEVDARFWDAVLLPEPVAPPDLDDPEPPAPTAAQLDAWAGETGPPRDETPPGPAGAEEAASRQDDAFPEPGWAVPGADGAGESSEDRLSARSEAALAEAAEAVRVMRLDGARMYRAITELENADAVAETGYRNLSRLLEDHVRLDTAEVKRLARHAAALRETGAPTGATVPADLPATAAAVDDGTIGEGHVEVIRLTMKRVGAVDDLAAEVLTTTEHVLAELAAALSPKALGASAKVIADRLDPDGVAPDEDPPPENELRYVVRRSGALHGTFVFRDPVAAELFATALAAATPPPDSDGVAGDDGRGPAGAHGERGESPDAHASRSRPARQAAAMLDLAAEALNRGLDEPEGPATAPSEARVPRHDQDTFEDVARESVSCDHHCAHPGCRRRARKCQAHHVVHWADGGETAVENLVLLCAYHHSLVHRSGWEIVMVDGLPWFVPPAWLDPLRTPRHNRPWQAV